MSDEQPTPAFWSDRYQRGHIPWDLGTVSAPVLAMIVRWFPPAGRVFVPGCGRGYEALHLAARGYRVTALDIVAEPVDYLRARAAEEGLSAERLEVRQEDMFALPAEYDGVFDVFLEQTCFCALHPRRHGDYEALARRVLKPGGQLLGVFMEVPFDDGPPFSNPPGQVLPLFAPAHWEHDGPHPVAPQNPARPGPEYLARFVRR